MRGGPSSSCLLSTWVAADPASVRLLNEITRIASSASTVLVRGESGVGKDLLAQVLHYLGPNPDGPFVRVECTSLPPEMIESELLGHEQQAGQPGAPGAPGWKRGRLELAEGGTLVLDEVAALSMPLQAKLLRALAERRFECPGSGRTVPLNARVIALTSVDLERAMARRSFRPDLYFFLNVVPILLPPLRERPGDIPALAIHFLKLLTEVHRKPRMTFSPAALAVLGAYSFPGNVRELRQIVEHAMSHGAPPDLLVQDLPPHLREATPVPERKVSLEELERDYIAEVLDYTQGRKTQAAQILGISRKTLLEKRKKYRLG